MQAPDSAVGKRVQCPSCKTPFVVPSPQPAAVGGGAGSPSTASSPSISMDGNGSKATTVTTANAASSTPTVCPSCGSKLLEGAVACMDCGYMIPSDTGP